MKRSSHIISAGIVGFLIGAMVGVFGSPKDGEENRKDFIDWMQKMSSDLNEKVDDATEMSKDKYDEMVDMVADKYRKAKKIKASDLDAFAADLKKHWSKVKKDWEA